MNRAKNEKQIGLGGGCHWCTEAVFASLRGVSRVEQGWISSAPPDDTFSEAVIVHYDGVVITLKDLVHIHLLTHASTSLHSMRHKYRSAVYYFSGEDAEAAKAIIEALQPGFQRPLIVQVLPFAGFRPSLPEHCNYYYAGPDKPFCRVYIDPKLRLLKEQFSKLADVR